MRRLVPAFAFAALTLCSASARADLIDPSEDACRGKKEGDPCDEGKPGACKKDTCSRLDYSEGTPPKSKSYDCLLCEPGATPTPDPAETKDAQSKSKPTGSPTPGEAEANAKKKGCSVGAAGTNLASLGLGLLVLGLVRRRQGSSQ